MNEGIMAALCNQLWDTGEDACVSLGLELGRAQYTLLPGSIDQQQACARGTLLASKERGAGLRCVLALFL